MALSQDLSNAFRACGNDAERAEFLKELEKKKGMSHGEIADAVGVSECLVSSRIKLTRLCPEDFEKLRRGEMPISVATSLAKRRKISSSTAGPLGIDEKTARVIRAIFSSPNPSLSLPQLKESLVNKGILRKGEDVGNAVRDCLYHVQKYLKEDGTINTEINVDHRVKEALEAAFRNLGVKSLWEMIFRVVKDQFVAEDVDKSGFDYLLSQ